MSGKLITIEGLDTAGKSTQANLLANKLRLDGHKVEVIHFPYYDGEIGKIILKFLNGECNFDREAVQMLYVADQMNVKDSIKYLLDNNYIVICDRYDLSTAVYYGASSKDYKKALEGFDYIYSNLQKNLLRPDITIVIDLPVEEIKKRKNELDIFESDENFMALSRILYDYSFIDNVIFDNRVKIKINGIDSINQIESEIYNKVKRNI